MSGPSPLRHPLLEQAGVSHGFGVRGSVAPPGASRPIQVHGNRVILAEGANETGKLEADAIVSLDAALPVAIVTADCVPILACGSRGEAVVAIHAGWRGLASGVIEAGIAMLRDNLPTKSAVTAVLGPHIGACCYEVDEPVLAVLRIRYGAAPLLRACLPTEPGHARISLADLADRALWLSGVEAECRGVVQSPCTCCGIERFHSYRRDGDRSGRLVHYIAPAQAAEGQQAGGKNAGVDRA